MKRFGSALLAALFVLAGCAAPAESPSAAAAPKLEVHALDVGQGDALFVRFPNGRTMLVDGGPRTAGPTVLAFLRKHRVKALDLVVATHPDADHISGLLPVLENVPVKRFLDSGKAHTTSTYYRMLQLIDRKRIPFEVAKTGRSLALDPSVAVRVLHADAKAIDTNDASIVLRLAYGTVSFLLTGDAEREAEAQMVKAGGLRSTFLKVGHHGSNSSTSPAFLKAVHPAFAILSYGRDNPYGHPKPRIVKALQAQGVRLFETAKSGTVSIETDGRSFAVRTKASEASRPAAPPKPSALPPKKASAQPKSAARVAIASKDLTGERIVLKNTGSSPVRLKGWTLLSVAGNQSFRLPDVALAPGESIAVASGPKATAARRTLVWTKSSVWNNGGDPAKLLDAKGRVVDEAS